MRSFIMTRREAVWMKSGENDRKRADMLEALFYIQ